MTTKTSFLDFIKTNMIREDEAPAVAVSNNVMPKEPVAALLRKKKKDLKEKASKKIV